MENHIIEQIKSLMDLYAFRDSVNSGEDYTRISVTLLADIYAERMDDWDGIGTMETPFNGRFYGGGHKISGIVYNSLVRDVNGLFGCVGEKGEIHELCVETAGECINTVGGVAGVNSGLISRCKVTGSLRADEKATQRYDQPATSGMGGMAGINQGTIYKCITDNLNMVRGGSVAGGMAGHNYGGQILECENKAVVQDCQTRYTEGFPYNCQGGIGGICGVSDQEGTLADCVNYGSISGCQATGGIVGLCQNSNISACFNYGPVEALKVWGGGIAGTFEKAGRMSCTVVNCINHANVTAADFSGGITGYAIEFGTSVSAGVKLSEKNRENGQSDSVGSILAVSITSCINKGPVMSAEKESSMGTGGIAGYSTARITHCLNQGEIVSKGAFAGGIVGLNRGVISDCANLAEVKAYAAAGGLAGKSDAGITACYAIGKVEAVSDSGGILGYLSAGIEETIVEHSWFCKELSGKATTAIGNRADSDLGLSLAQMTGTAARRYMPELFEFEWWTVAEKQGLFGSPKLKDYKWD